MFAAQQLEAVDKIVDWYENPGQQVFRLFGYAGTGKTTMAKHIVAELGLSDRVLYAAYTGKAAYVLRTKDCHASTIHSLIYTPVEKLRARLRDLHEQLQAETDPGKQTELRRAIAGEEEKLARPNFILKENSELNEAPLLVVDEVSMVGHGMAIDLLSFGTKLLVLGDPAQLPPVDGGGYFIDARPDHLLTEIHRSALDSPVTRLATAVRHSDINDRGLGIRGPDGDSGRLSRLSGHGELLEFDQVLVGTNRVRWQYLHLLRALKGVSGPLPVPGDRIMVLTNNPTAGVFNGQQLDVITCDVDRKSEDVLNLIALDDEGNVKTLDVWAAGFVDIEGEKNAKRNGRGKVVAATFGQAITTHKSQGSQWDRVCVIDESNTFGFIAHKEHLRAGGTRAEAGERAHLAAKRWLYTAVTRAAERVVVLGGRA